MKFKSSVVFGATALTNVSNVLTANISISHTIYGVELRLRFRAEAAVPPSDHWFSPETEEVKQIMMSDPSRSGTADTAVTTSDSGYRIRISDSRKVGKMDYKYINVFIGMYHFCLVPKERGVPPRRAWSCSREGPERKSYFTCTCQFLQLR